jgi:hypothetical protein
MQWKVAIVVAGENQVGEAVGMVINQGFGPLYITVQSSHMKHVDIPE